MKPLLSVIIPVYNVEKYLTKCVDSILAQTYENLEIILVDDGSPDGCPAICDEYAKKHKKIKVIHKINGGLSSARNAGFTIAKGEFISFIDSDDFICGESLYEDIITCFFKYENVDVVQMPKVLKYGSRDAICQNNINKDWVLDSQDKKFKNFDPYYLTIAKHEFITITVWDKVYRKTAIEKFKFDNGFIFEDVTYNLKVIKNCRNIVLASTSGFYAYIEREDSLSRPSNQQRLALTEREKTYLISHVWSNALLYRFHVKCTQNLQMESKLLKEIFTNYSITTLRYPNLYHQYHRIIKNLPKPNLGKIDVYSFTKLLLLRIIGNNLYGQLMRTIYSLKQL